MNPQALRQVPNLCLKALNPKLCNPINPSMLNLITLIDPTHYKPYDPYMRPRCA